MFRRNFWLTILALLLIFYISGIIGTAQAVKVAQDWLTPYFVVIFIIEHMELFCDNPSDQRDAFTLRERFGYAPLRGP